MVVSLKIHSLPMGLFTFSIFSVRVFFFLCCASVYSHRQGVDPLHLSVSVFFIAPCDAGNHVCMTVNSLRLCLEQMGLKS